ncbi:unnamed protein product [Chondrus crispus]|uniref:Uncharacterized protein n=1 Tax=Chondrus crispus TaxID=2769 RepID=R7Q6F9_CHOCR|nr:unnamed protein product [Chondrus crispus]CDF33035.1 unnamed protein product [Chondrus crispus]|eukprot:XP_005712838.1 unnamed protein product [Chondrus crispus]
MKSFLTTFAGGAQAAVGGDADFETFLGMERELLQGGVEELAVHGGVFGGRNDVEVDGLAADKEYAEVILCGVVEAL